ncbi:50S ribosomal protein L13 [Candidatus Parcubacteria bacterium]|nr:50S ribosomal protein L13 [Candidatus Parcubacteria bacterium]
MEKFTLDATNKKPGRLATEIAVLLMGKNRPDFVRNAIPDVKVEVTNANQMSFDPKKLTQKFYARHSGYPGSLKTPSQAEVITKKGGKEVLRTAVSGMLPKNKLRPLMMKHLTIKD